MATPSVAPETHRIGFHLGTNARPEGYPKRTPVVDSFGITHHGPAIPAVVSTSGYSAFGPWLPGGAAPQPQFDGPLGSVTEDGHLDDVARPRPQREMASEVLCGHDVRAVDGHHHVAPDRDARPTTWAFVTTCDSSKTNPVPLPSSVRTRTTEPIVSRYARVYAFSAPESPPDPAEPAAAVVPDETAGSSRGTPLQPARPASTAVLPSSSASLRVYADSDMFGST